MKTTKIEMGKRVSSLRRRNRMTQEDLAEQLDCSVKHISHVERDTALLSLDKCVLLSDLFHCSLDYLLKGKGQDDLHNILPSSILEILSSDNEEEHELLLTYLNMYSRIRNAEVKKE